MQLIKTSSVLALRHMIMSEMLLPFMVNDVLVDDCNWSAIFRCVHNLKVCTEPCQSAHIWNNGCTSNGCLFPCLIFKLSVKSRLQLDPERRLKVGVQCYAAHSAIWLTEQETDTLDGNGEFDDFFLNREQKPQHLKDLNHIRLSETCIEMVIINNLMYCIWVLIWTP